MIKELVMVHDGVCCLSSDEFIRDDCVCTDFLSVSALQVIFYNEMRYINLRFTYLTY